MHFSYTFSSSDSTVTVRGFYQDVRLQVKMHMKRSDLLNIEVIYTVTRLSVLTELLSRCQSSSENAHEEE